MAGQLKIAGAVADGSITTAKLADDAVTAAKIADSAVQNGQIADNAVTANKIMNGQIGITEMANNSIGTAEIVDEAVTLAKLEHGTSSNDGKFLRANNGADPTFETVNTTPADGSVTKAKLATGSSLPLNFGVISMVDSWGLSSSTNYNSNNHITNNWTRVTGLHGGNVGSVSMSESAGVFTFPETGLYFVMMQFGFYAVGGTMGFAGIKAQLSEDGGSSYNTLQCSFYHSSQNSQYGRIIGQELYRVQGTASNFKLRFQLEVANLLSIQGGQGRTSLIFVKYGDL